MNLTDYLTSCLGYTPRQEVRPKVVETAFKLAEDLDLICENEDTDKAVAQFFKSVPKVLRQFTSVH